METILWFAVIVLGVILVAITNKKRPTFGKAQFMNLVNQVRKDFADPNSQKLVVKYVKATTGICGVTFTALSELKTDINKNGLTISENGHSIAAMQAEIRQMERENAHLADKNTELYEYQSLAS